MYKVIYPTVYGIIRIKEAWLHIEQKADVLRIDHEIEIVSKSWMAWN